MAVDPVELHPLVGCKKREVGVFGNRTLPAEIEPDALLYRLGNEEEAPVQPEKGPVHQLELEPEPT